MLFALPFLFGGVFRCGDMMGGYDGWGKPMMFGWRTHPNTNRCRRNPATRHRYQRTSSFYDAMEILNRRGHYASNGERIYFTATDNQEQQIPYTGGYTLDDFRKSVVDGQHPDRDQLDMDMPRWEMSNQDLSDLFVNIKTLL